MRQIVEGGLDDARVVSLLQTHWIQARAQTAAGSAHALDLDGLRDPQLRFWSLWDVGAVLAVGALKQLSSDHAEVKSMHTDAAARGRGVGGEMLRHIIGTARDSGFRRLSLETGSWDYFAPARAFYRKHGFVDCPPFVGYVDDPNSVFMTLVL